jgi:serine phosphatase RsbU (regulator of sigma subunit)/pSer/pThr/pTyr-binding forkhead associated (FHA) protein
MQFSFLYPLLHPLSSRDMAPVLEVITAEGQTDRVELDRSPLIIGRLSECDIQLESPRVSRRHAELVSDESGCWILRDLESRNGTRVNGESITERPILPGDFIEIGPFQLQLLSTTEAAEEPTTESGQTTIWSMDETELPDMQRLSSSPAPRLNAAHLAKVNALSKQLVEIPDAQARLISLCQALVGRDLLCIAAGVLRMGENVQAQPPQLLCPFQFGDGTAEAPTVSRPLLQAAIEDQQPILAGGTTPSGLTVNLDDVDRGVTAVIACPLRHEGANCDILYATLPHDVGTIDWLALVALAAEQWKKAELQIEARQSSKDSATIHHELMKARKIQMSLLPTAPSAPGLEIAIGYEPCLWIGGDYANVLTMPDGRVLLTVADVAGKGLPAAMVATGVHSIVHSASGAGADLTEIAQSINRFLLESMDRQSFVTMLGFLFEQNTGNAQCINAGHPPMLIFSPDGATRVLPYAHNPPLGVMPTDITLDDAVLNPGELLLLYTDGLTEMLDSAGKMLNIEGVERNVSQLFCESPGLPLKELADRVTKMLDTLRGSSPVTDDRTFILARRQPSTKSQP